MKSYVNKLLILAKYRTIITKLNEEKSTPHIIAIYNLGSSYIYINNSSSEQQLAQYHALYE